MRVKFHPEARADLREGNAFYRHRSPIAAVAFADTIDASIKKIAESPFIYPMGEHGTRELVLPRRFPYTIVYQVTKDVIVIVAIAHHSRLKGYWQSRT